MSGTTSRSDADFIDVLASGVHDTKNTLFDALSRIDAIRRGLPMENAETAVLLDEAYTAIDRTAERLARILSAYRLVRHENPIAPLPTPLADMAEYVRLRAAAEWQGTATLIVKPADAEPWIMDRELVADCIVNALLNASRHARARVTIEFRTTADGLCIEVADDGPGFPEAVLRGEEPAGSIGLFLATRIAGLHRRDGRCGRLELANLPSGGAQFRLVLP
jgi:signal transduction histidine kinase